MPLQNILLTHDLLPSEIKNATALSLIFSTTVGGASTYTFNFSLPDAQVAITSGIIGVILSEADQELIGDGRSYYRAAVQGHTYQSASYFIDIALMPLTSPGGITVSGAPSGAAGGELSGTYPDPLVLLQTVLDRIFGSTRGNVIYRGASAWAALGAGNASQVLTAHGANTDPTWETPSAGGGGLTLLDTNINTTNQTLASGTTILIPGFTSTVTVDAGKLVAVAFLTDVALGTPSSPAFQLYLFVDGQEYDGANPFGQFKIADQTVFNQSPLVFLAFVSGLSAGSHTFELRYNTNPGAGNAYINNSGGASIMWVVQG